MDTEIALSFVNFGRPATGQRTMAAGFKSVYELPNPPGNRNALTERALVIEVAGILSRPRGHDRGVNH